MARYIEDTNLIEEIKSLKISVGGKDIFPDEAKESVLRVINEQPTADVAEVKHGHWIKRGNEKKCSVCEFVYYSNNDDWNGCPNCLAKMDGKGDT